MRDDLAKQKVYCDDHGEGETQADKCLGYQIDTLEQLLSGHGVEIRHHRNGEGFDPKLHHVLQLTETDQPERHHLIRTEYSPAYIRNGIVLKPMDVEAEVFGGRTDTPHRRDQDPGH